MAFTPEPALIESAGKINTESFGRRVRVHSVAKELGITSKEFITVLGEFGITGKVRCPPRRCRTRRLPTWSLA